MCVIFKSERRRKQIDLMKVVFIEERVISRAITRCDEVVFELPLDFGHKNGDLFVCHVEHYVAYYSHICGGEIVADYIEIQERMLGMLFSVGFNEMGGDIDSGVGACLKRGRSGHPRQVTAADVDN